MNKNQRYLFNIIYFVLVFSLVFLIGNVIEVDINILYQISIIIVTIFIIKFLIDNPMVFPIVLVLTGIISAIVNRYVEFLPRVFNRLSYLFSNIIQNLQGKERMFPENILGFWIIIIILVAIFTCFFIFKKKNPWILIAIYVPSFIYYWYTFYNEALFFMAVFFMAIIILIGLNSYIKETNKLLSSPAYDVKDIYPNWRRTLIRYAIIIVLIASIIPKNSDYISWPWLNRKVTSAFPRVEEFRASEKYSRRSGQANLFDFSNTGFMGEDGKLGGPVELSDKKVMTVLTPNPIYLRGNVLEKYTGFNWTSRESSFENYRLKEDFSGINPEERMLYYRQEDITIINELFASTAIFSPYKPYKVFSNDSYPILVDENHAIKAPNGIYKDESYLVRVQSPLPYGILKSKGINRKKSELENLNNYIDLPNNISDRTIQLTKDIVGEIESDFEKAVAIEKYLRTNFPYNLQVEEVPSGSEFLDYFLFEEQQGYCTYYATAMAVMLRLEGIPSRYVEGYLVKDKVDDEEYEVKQRNAHAWVEAYIEPVGWVTFEATPAFEVSPRYEDYELDSSSETDEFEEEDISLEDFQDLGGDSQTQEGEMEDDGDINPYTLPENEKEINYQYTMFTVIGLFIGFFILYILSNMWKIRKEKKTFKSLPPKEKIIYLYRDITKIASNLGYSQELGETHFEYADRINYKFYDLDGLGIKEITEIFVKAKYSDSIPSQADIDTVLKYKTEMDNRLKNRLGKFKYYYLKYIKNKV